MKAWVTRAEAARMLGCSTQTISNYAKRGILTEKRNAQLYLYQGADIEKLLQLGTTKTIEELKAETEVIISETEELRRKAQDEMNEAEEALLLINNGRKNWDGWGRYKRLIEAIVLMCNPEFTKFESLIMQDVLNFTPADLTAEYLGCRVHTVKSRYEKALRKIREFPGVINQKFADYEKRIDDLTKEIEKYRNMVNGENSDSERTNHGDEIFRLQEPFTTKIEDCHFSVRTYNCLHAVGIKTIGDIVAWKRSDFMRLRNFGKKSLIELDEFLERNNLSYEMWTKPQIKFKWIR